MADLTTMYPPQAGSPETTITGALTASGTTVTVADGAILPAAPNFLTIGSEGGTAETVLMTGKNGNTLTITRGQDGTAARAWSAGTSIGRFFTAADQAAMQSNINALNTAKLEKVPSPTADNFASLNSDGTLKNSGKKAGDFATASHSHSQYAAATHTHSEYAPASHNHSNYALTTHTHDGYAAANHNHDSSYAAASHAHAGYAQILIFQNKSVAASAWGSDATYTDYPFSATISATAVTADHLPEVNFGAVEAAGGNFAPVALSGANTVKIYAKAKPTATITIPSILCTKAVT